MDSVRVLVLLLTVTILASGGIINLPQDDQQDDQQESVDVIDNGSANTAIMSITSKTLQKMSKKDAEKWLIKKKFCEEFPNSMWCLPTIETDFPDVRVPSNFHCFNGTSKILCVSM